MQVRLESADKPGSVVDSHSSGMRFTARLVRPTREPCGPHVRGLCSLPPYLVLLRMGFTLPLPLPKARCALTAPFHPYPFDLGRTGGIFSVALSVGSRPPGITWHPALWSPDFPPPGLNLGSDCLANSVIQSIELDQAWLGL